MNAQSQIPVCSLQMQGQHEQGIFCCLRKGYQACQAKEKRSVFELVEEGVVHTEAMRPS